VCSDAGFAGESVGQPLLLFCSANVIQCMSDCAAKPLMCSGRSVGREGIARQRVELLLGMKVKGRQLYAAEQ
jgi:hypothetical protein